MNFKIPAFVGGGAFILSFLSALIGGVTFFEALLRGFFWTVLAGLLTAGAEFLLRMQLPDLFQSSASRDSENDSREQGESKVDITLEDERPSGGSFVEEMAESSDDEPPPAFAATPLGDQSQEKEVEPPRGFVEPPAESRATDEEDLPEIGSFLDSFRPQTPRAEGEEGEEEAVQAPASGGEPEAPGEGVEDFSYAPSPSSQKSSSQVNLEGQEQDPAVLAKAVQTVMKKGQ